jgi:hypothetical protein
LLVLNILKTEKSRVRDRFISYSKYFRRGTLFVQKKVGSALTETENWDLLVDCTSRDGRQMLDAGVHLSDKRTYRFKHSTKYSTKSASAFTNGDKEKLFTLKYMFLWICTIFVQITSSLYFHTTEHVT